MRRENNLTVRSQIVSYRNTLARLRHPVVVAGTVTV